jgi:hypothetical protein
VAAKQRSVTVEEFRRGLGLGLTLGRPISGMFVPRYGDAFALRIGPTIVTLMSAYGAYMFWQISKSVVGDWRIEANLKLCHCRILT